MLNCIDNSGAAVVECAQVLKMKRHAKIGTYTYDGCVTHSLLRLIAEFSDCTYGSKSSRKRFPD